MSAKLLHAREREETLVRRQSPLTKEMFVAMAKLASKSDPDSSESLIFDWFCLWRVAGFRVAEYAQKTQLKFNEHEYISGNKVAKVFIASDWKIYDEQGHIVRMHSLDGLADSPKKMKLTFTMQKNHRNGESITFVANDKHQHICPVRAAYRIYL
jgi:hypothetical protein